MPWAQFCGEASDRSVSEQPEQENSEHGVRRDGAGMSRVTVEHACRFSFITDNLRSRVLHTVHNASSCQSARKLTAHGAPVSCQVQGWEHFRGAEAHGEGGVLHICRGALCRWRHAHGHDRRNIPTQAADELAHAGLVFHVDGWHSDGQWAMSWGVGRRKGWEMVSPGYS